MAGPLWTTTYVAMQNALDPANPNLPNWSLITYAPAIDDRRKDFAKPAGAFKTLHFWNRESEEKKKTISRGFDLATCDLDVDGNVVKEKKILSLNNAAFAMAGSSSGLAGLLTAFSAVPTQRGVDRIGAAGGAELTIHCARIGDDELNPKKWETHTVMVVAPRAWWQATPPVMTARGWVELTDPTHPTTQVTLTELGAMLPTAKARAGAKIKVKKKFWSS